jgi:hypothetical protein
VILNISGNDVLSRLQNKKYTRRCRSTKGVWISIDSVTRQGLRDGKLTYEPTKKFIDMWGGKLDKEDNTTFTRGLVLGEEAERIGQNYTKKEVVIDVRPGEGA